MATILSTDVRLVMLQFSFSNRGVVPAGVPRKEYTPEEFASRQNPIEGEQVIVPTQMVGLAKFLEDLEEANYLLVDAFWRERQKNGRSFYAVRFTFVQAEHARLSEAFLSQRMKMVEALVQMARDSMWRVRGFLNPFFKDQEVVDGVYAISINLEARSPLVDGNGSPLFVWAKDENGQKVGDKPVSLQPHIFLRIEDGELALEQA